MQINFFENRNNNDDANKNILTALEEVDNTFFVENSSSDSEENTSDHENVDDIDNLNKNFNEMHLNNFKFVKNSNNFIEDEVYNKLKLEYFWEYSLKERTHGNTGRASKNMKHIKNFNKISIPVIFLPTSFSYTSVYHDYVQAYKNEHEEETIKLDIQYAIEYEKKLAVTEKYLVYLNWVKQEHEYYNANIKQAVEDGKCNFNKIGSQILFKSFEGSVHITFDWIQNVQIPYSPQQINYVIDEGEMLNDGKLGKGVNCTISLAVNACEPSNELKDELDFQEFIDKFMSIKNLDKSELSSAEELQHTKKKNYMQFMKKIYQKKKERDLRLQLWACEIINKGITYKVSPSYSTFDVKLSIPVNRNNLTIQVQVSQIPTTPIPINAFHEEEITVNIIKDLLDEQL
ncbi:hypothetical protein C1645_827556 [Glomus cerebriforme]|uniref:Uncharacterized protein n=1 Tax=Glomus cerebriforme TaxID=658196 RepID=A0A397SSP0_9GLOM|nr:hypothetical protein C1645_827556 [Glomus cerebriforme]